MKSTLICLLSWHSLAAQSVPGRYILELTEAPSNAARRPAMLRQQRSVQSALAARGIRVRATVDAVANAIIVEGTDSQALAGLAGVRKAHAVKILEKSLDHALGLMKIPEAWQQVGGSSNAGAGTKIGIIDTGIDPYHAGFQDRSLTVPDGFPKFSSDANRVLTNNKIIVARSYDLASALDREGHGTAVAMIAAGVSHSGGGVVLSGAAPKAFLGAYRANEGISGQFTSDTILRAIDDAVKDGMDVINMSLGAPGLAISENEILTAAISQAVARGTVVITAAGNSGPDQLTVSDTGAAPDAISVGSTPNDRAPAAPGLTAPEFSLNYAGLAASNSSGSEPLRGKMMDLMTVDATGLGCLKPAAGAYAGKIVLMQRGTCAFEEKFNNADAGDAAAVVVFNNQDDPARISMEVGKARLKGLFLSRADGLALRQKLAAAANRETEAVLSFRSFEWSDPDRISGYSSRGPSLDLAIKPDMVAIGGYVITAASGTEANRPETSGYLIGSGTSLAAPMVAGAAAVLKAARPGLSVAQYKSLLVNSSTRFPSAGQAVAVQQSGAGMLNLQGALTSTIAASPVSLGFGEYKSAAIDRELTISNLGTATESYTLGLRTTDSLKPQLQTSSVTLEPGKSAKIAVQLNTPGAAAGEYQGLLEITSNSGSVARVPYWAGVRAKEPARISLTIAPSRGAAGTLVQVAFRVIDTAGFYFDPAVEMTAVSGGGEVTNLLRLGGEYPGLYLATLRLGPAPGLNVFKITGSGIEREVRISGER